MENLYEILQCEPTASRDELRHAYTKLALAYHPDKWAQRQPEIYKSRASGQNIPSPAVCVKNLGASVLNESAFEAVLRCDLSEAQLLNGCSTCGKTDLSEQSISKSEMSKEMRKDFASDHNFLEVNTTFDDKFLKIAKAWEILGDPDLRAEYDIKWQDRCLAQEHPIQDTVPFVEFEYDEAEVYTYPCRCGSEFVLSKLDKQLFYDIVCCETCSLTIQIDYTGAY